MLQRCGWKGHIATTCMETTREDGSVIGEREQDATNLMNDQAKPDVFDFDNELEQDNMEEGYHFTQYCMSVVYNEDIRGKNQHCLNEKDTKGRLKKSWIYIVGQSVHSPYILEHRLPNKHSKNK